MNLDKKSKLLLAKSAAQLSTALRSFSKFIQSTISSTAEKDVTAKRLPMGEHADNLVQELKDGDEFPENWREMLIEALCKGQYRMDRCKLFWVCEKDPECKRNWRRSTTKGLDSFKHKLLDCLDEISYSLHQEGVLPKRFKSKYKFPFYRRDVLPETYTAYRGFKTVHTILQEIHGYSVKIR